MPNGYDKNWVRLCAALDGFFVRYGRWPTRVRLFPGALENLRTDVLDPDAFATVTSKVELVPDEASMLAEDDEGRAYDYGKEGFPPRSPDLPAREWLGVHPDPALGG
jgi:hypothetical protein